MSGEFVARPTV